MKLSLIKPRRAHIFAFARALAAHWIYSEDSLREIVRLWAQKDETGALSYASSTPALCCQALAATRSVPSQYSAFNAAALPPSPGAMY